MLKLGNHFGDISHLFDLQVLECISFDPPHETYAGRNDGVDKEYLLIHSSFSMSNMLS